MIELVHVTKRFGAVSAVSDLTLRVAAGEFFGFLGPNGAGKTTTIKMMTGLFAPSEGKVLLRGFDIQAAPEQAKMETGYIPDQPFLYEKLTGREFLYFSAGLYKVGRGLSRERIRELAELLEIGSWIDRRAESYSQGMRQRVAIAAALLHAPRILIIDEPMVGLDPRSISIVKRVLRLRADQGTAVFMSTHSLPVVEELCDRAGILKDGRLVHETPAGSFRRRLQGENRGGGSFEELFLELTR